MRRQFASALLLSTASADSLFRNNTAIATTMYATNSLVWTVTTQT